MAGVFRKAKLWLGLAPDEDYDEHGYGREEQPRYGPGPNPGPRAAAPRPGPQRPRSVPDGGYDDQVAQPRPVSKPSGSVRTLPPTRPVGAPDRAPTRTPDTPTVRPMRPTSAKPTVIQPDGFDDAKIVADRFKANQPVVMDLREVDRELARRLIDFSSGMCYALGGHMERVASGRYLLTPSNVEVSDAEKRRLSGRD